jgi:hypothetical protein
MAYAKGPTAFTVEGTYPFPVDMLRYDACWPATSEDAVQLGESCSFTRRMNRKDNEVTNDNTKRKRQVKLYTNAQNRPTVGRWESFGWKVG